MKDPPRPNPLRRLIATAPRPKRPLPVPDPQAFPDEPLTLKRSIEAEVAQLARCYRKMSPADRAELLADAERRANRK